MPVRDFFQQKLGFTRSEIAVIGLLCAGLMAGSAVRLFRSTPAGQRVFPYAATDSAFARGARALHDARAMEKNAGAPAATRGPVEINRAMLPDLIALPGIGPATAARIIAYRNAHGRFGSIDELDRVKGIGPATLLKLRPFLRCAASTRAAGASSHDQHEH